MDERVSVEDAYQSKGSFNLSYVREMDGRLGIYLLSFIIPSWEAEPVSSYQYQETDTLEEIEARYKLDLWSASSIAIKQAYNLADKEIKPVDYKLYVAYSFSEYANRFKVGDLLVSIDGHTFKSKEECTSYIESRDDESYVDVVVIRSDKQVKFKSKIYAYDERKILGISLVDIYDYETSPRVDVKYKKNESGSSAGMMTTLEIYDKLIPEDLTHSLKIAGTGTIDEDGNIGEIGGVRHKLMGAVSGKADLFLVPNGKNYEECMKLKKEKGYNIKIIGVGTIKEAISKLEGLGDEV